VSAFEDDGIAGVWLEPVDDLASCEYCGPEIVDGEVGRRPDGDFYFRTSYGCSSGDAASSDDPLYVADALREEGYPNRRLFTKESVDEAIAWLKAQA